MARTRQAKDHYTISMGRSTVVCRCGWALKRSKLYDTESQDQDELRKLHAEHVIKAMSKGG